MKKRAFLTSVAILAANLLMSEPSSAISNSAIQDSNSGVKFNFSNPFVLTNASTNLLLARGHSSHSSHRSHSSHYSGSSSYGSGNYSTPSYTPPGNYIPTPPSEEPTDNTPKSSSSSLSTPTTLVPVVDTKYQYIDNMLSASLNDEESVIMANNALINALQKPQGHDKLLARELNQKSLALIKQLDFSQATALLAAAHELDSSDVEIANNYGYVLMKSNDLDKAKSILQDALLLKPDRATAWSNLADVLALKGDENFAVAAYLNTYRFSRNKFNTYQFFQHYELSDKSSAVKRAVIEATERAKKLFQLNAN